MAQLSLRLQMEDTVGPTWTEMGCGLADIIFWTTIE
jgi:hypothetical protein